MLPAEQGFKANDAVVGKRDHRLVVQAQFPSLDCLAEVRLELEHGCRPRVHVLVEHPGAGSAANFRLVYGDIRLAQKVLRPPVGSRHGGDADTYGHQDLVAVQVEGNGQLLVDPLGQDLSVFGSGNVHQNGELVTTETGDGVARPKDRSQSSRHGNQQRGHRPDDRDCRSHA